MKFLAFILSIIVLALTCVPCTDAEGLTMHSGKNDASITKANCPFGADQRDDCSPFCTCNCCAGFSIHNNITSLSSIEIYTKLQFATYLPANTAEISLPVWQPPRL